MELKLTRRASNAGKIDVHKTDWHSGEYLQFEFDLYINAAIEGVQSMADELGVNLGDFDIILQKFLIHEVDSFDLCYKHAGRIAFRAAYESFSYHLWERQK
ncbi:MAG: hypothetical protein P8M30_08540 [Planctomycetaceae bacterium]|nr:hypothetical protein [Planctomycetaceae bacterium]